MGEIYVDLDIDGIYLGERKRGFCSKFFEWQRGQDLMSNFKS